LQRRRLGRILHSASLTGERRAADSRQGGFTSLAASQGGSVKILMVSDAWYPQVNGVVRTLATVRDELIKLGHSVEIIGPDRFRTVPMPTYPEIRLAVGAGRKMAKLIEAIDPGAIHIATEGPLGFAARAWCLKHGVPFTTAYHTRFPEYVRNRAPIPLALSYALVRRFHAPAFAVMVATKSIEEALKAKGFRNIRRWSRGVDTDLFRPRDKSFLTYPRPISMYVGRIAVEKNLEAFLKLDIPGTKVIVGDGPQMEEYQRRYPEAKFEGVRHGEELAKYYAAADVFVFPSRTDTFGLVLLEALASGVPVAAYPVPGPLDVLEVPDGAAPVGCLDEDLARAVISALPILPERCREHALTYSWRASAEQFLSNLKPLDQTPDYIKAI
jgi:glycosyltransferase involved in cell wall biosynthesis